MAAVDAVESVDPDKLVAEHRQLGERLRVWLAVLRVAGQVQGRVKADAAIELAIDTQLGDFRILRMIGCGGMTIVFEAGQVSLRRRMALKVQPFAAALDLQQLRRFQIEAQTTAPRPAEPGLASPSA
jgi:hypothetical protein